MTTLEIVLIAIIWISYGVFSAHLESLGEFGDYVFFIMIAPFAFVVKIIIAPFRKL